MMKCCRPEKFNPSSGVSAYRLVLAGLVLSCGPFFAVWGQSEITGNNGQAGGGNSAPADYVLQRGDDIEISAYNIPELNEAIRIRPDGKISVPLLNDVEAAGLTPRQLSDSLAAAWAQHFRNPRVNVLVRNFANLNIFVGGEVLNPGLIPLRGDLTALQAVLQAGGLKETSRASTVTLLRTAGDGKPQSITLNVNEILSGKEADIRLRPSDVIYVPKSNISVYVGGEVVHAGLLPLNGELTLLAAVIQAGGVKDTAKPDSVFLVRNSGAQTPVVTPFSLRDVLKGKQDQILQPFDIVFVPRSRIANMDRFMDQYIRQMIPVNVAAGFSYVLGAAVLK